MKNVITIIACVLILAIFLTQITINEVTHTKIVYCEEVVNTAMQQARQEGCITAAIRSNIKTKIAAKAKCSEDEVTITGTLDTPVYRGQLIEYSVSYKIKGVIGGASIFGISADNNNINKILNGSVVSEYVGP